VLLQLRFLERELIWIRQSSLQTVDMRKRKKKRNKSDQEQITIERFADAKSSSSRIRKNAKPIDLEIDADSVEDIEMEDEEEEAVTHRVKNESKNVETWNGEISYPYDLWEILSEYISPESVGKFACLCKSAHLSIKRVSFWLNLHDIYAARVSRKAFRTKGKQILPIKLQSDYVNRFCQGNLRSLVIRSLFFTHEAFTKRLLTIQNKIDPHSVVGFTCISAYTTRKASSYRYYFKVTSKQDLSKVLVPEIQNESEMDDDVPWYLHSNENKTDISISPEESCQLLQIDCDAFNFLPGTLNGLRIHAINITSSGEGFRYQKINMILGPRHFRETKDSKGKVKILSPHSVVLNIGNITAINLVKWYHPIFYNV